MAAKSSLSITSSAVLNSGGRMPLLGLGTYKTTDSTTLHNVIDTAWKTGCRHIDTARFYENEKEIGEALKELKIPRDEIFLTTKLWISDHGYDKALAAFEASLRRLGTDYVDLYLIHWPGVSGLSDTDPRQAELRRESWRALEKLHKDGKAKAIGVSNYTVRHLEQLLSHATVKPAVNQVEFHPKLYQKELLDFCRRTGIQLEAYSSFGKGKLLSDPKIGAIAKKYGKDAAQLLVRWVLQHDVVVIPKSSSVQRVVSNADVYDFAISDEDMAVLDGMNENWHCTWDPTSIA
eukprot:TRINITY_DN30809_c0_g1_i1.p1 TRINITY_DN30809_c0_g1~~TRINITY_DN30809_c0_g1_i1.p1  ORF type:complete len:291 (+),score=72.62 TRINITY_DN30809_c0_g1_i1:170-1042(+)